MDGAKDATQDTTPRAIGKSAKRKLTRVRAFPVARPTLFHKPAESNTFVRPKLRTVAAPKMPAFDR